MTSPALPPPLADVLAAYGRRAEGASAHRPSAGLIQTTWLVTLADGERVVAQRHHPVFDPQDDPEAGERLLADIAVIGDHLAAAQVVVPKLVPRRMPPAPSSRYGFRDGDRCLWRLMTFVPGETIERIDHPGRAFTAAALVARFHAAVAGVDHRFGFTRPGAHDTLAHLARLEAHAGMSAAAAHAAGVADDVRRLADRIIAAAAARPPLPTAPQRICHGDLKISNVLFAPDGEACALVDLDTLGHLTLGYELGDALRSWCNPVGEDHAETRFDLTTFEAAARGFAAGAAAAGLSLDLDEPDSLFAGLVTVALELAARFCTDAFEERYFGWDPGRFPSRREHNRVRAAGQLALAESAAAAAGPARALLTAVFGRPQRVGPDAPPR